MVPQKPLPGCKINHSHPLARGLVGCWLFNERGGNIIRDISGRGFNGMITGSTWDSGLGGSLIFNNDAANYYVDLGIPVVGTAMKGLTVEAWMYLTSTTVSQMILENGTAYNTNSFLLMLDTTTPDTFTFTIYGAASYGSRPSPAVTAINCWYHVVGVWTPSRVDLYVNAIKSAVTLVGTVRVSLIDGNTNLNMGRRPSATPVYPIAAGGKVGLTRIWNRGLIDNEVLQLYQSPYAMFARQPLIVKTPAAGPSGFKPAWAQRCNRLIGVA
jgi:hypothetical protein